MLLDSAKLRELRRLLHEARLASPGPGAGCYCTTPLTGPDGRTWRWEPKPFTRNGARVVLRTSPGVLPDGTKVEEMPGGGFGLKIPLGVHGRAFLSVEPETGKIVCAKCAGAR